MEELEKKLEKMNEVKNLLVYKIENYDKHIAKFKSGEITTKNVEKLWERKT